jgi:hypothetical protein
MQKKRGTALEGRQYPRVSLTDQVQGRAGQGSRLDAAPLLATIASCELLPRLVHPLISRAKLSQMASSDWPSSLGFSARLSAVTKMQVLRREKRPRKSMPFRCQLGHYPFSNTSHVPCLPPPSLLRRERLQHRPQPRATPQSYTCLTPCHLVLPFNACSNQVTELPLFRGLA